MNINKALFATFFSMFTIYHTVAAQSKIPAPDTTSKPVEGTYFEKGRMKVKTGYRASVDSNNQTITIYRIAGGSPTSTGVYKCFCVSGAGNCIIQGRNITPPCAPDNSNSCSDCFLYRSGSGNGGTIANKPGEGTGWKKMILAGKSN